MPLIKLEVVKTTLLPETAAAVMAIGLMLGKSDAEELVCSCDDWTSCECVALKPLPLALECACVSGACVRVRVRKCTCVFDVRALAGGRDSLVGTIMPGGGDSSLACCRSGSAISKVISHFCQRLSPGERCRQTMCLIGTHVHRRQGLVERHSCSRIVQVLFPPPPTRRV